VILLVIFPEPEDRSGDSMNTLGWKPSILVTDQVDHTFYNSQDITAKIEPESDPVKRELDTSIVKGMFSNISSFTVSICVSNLGLLSLGISKEMKDSLNFLSCLLLCPSLI